MPRKGWSQLDVPSGWVHAAQWPKASSQHRRQQGGHRQRLSGKGAGPAKRFSTLREASRLSEAAAVDAVAEVQRLQSAIAALGDTNNHAGPLKERLSCAVQNQSAAIGGWGGVMQDVHRTVMADFGQLWA